MGKTATAPRFIDSAGKEHVLPVSNGKPLFVRAMDSLWAGLVVKPAKQAIPAAGGLLTVGVVTSLTGRNRVRYAPAWFAAAAVLPIPHAVGAWLAVSALFLLASAPVARRDVHVALRWALPARRYLSPRECVFVGQAAACVALWHSDAPLVRAQWQVALLVAAVLPGAIQWWHGRRIREHPDTTPPFIHRWVDDVLPRYPKLIGEFIDHYPERNMWLYRTLELTAQEVVDKEMERLVEFALAQT